jgi:TrmH family RNA methyltransferase
LIKQLSKLKQKKYRQKEKQFLVEGKHLVEEAYLAGYLMMVLSIDESPYDDIDSYLVTTEIIDKLSEVKNNQNIVGVCHIPNHRSNTNRILMLDGVQDPGNMGTLMRSAVSFGFSTIVLDHCVDIFNPKVIRSTQGAIFKLNYIYEDILSFMNKHDDITYIATDLKAQKDIEDIELPAGPFALILGNEGNGIRETVSDASDIQVKIHMTNTESLNVAVAGSICMYLLKGN